MARFVGVIIARLGTLPRGVGWGAVRVQNIEAFLLPRLPSESPRRCQRPRVMSTFRVFLSL
jgi:hypothetical protein